MPYQQNRQTKCLPQSTPRLAIEYPSSSNKQTTMCDFHLTTDHDGASCPEMARVMQMHLMAEKIEEYVAPKDVTEPTVGTSSVNFLEYESDGEDAEDINNHSCNAATPNWRQRLEEKWAKRTKEKTSNETAK